MRLQDVTRACSGTEHATGFARTSSVVGGRVALRPSLGSTVAASVLETAPFGTAVIGPSAGIGWSVGSVGAAVLDRSRRSPRPDTTRRTAPGVRRPAVAALAVAGLAVSLLGCGSDDEPDRSTTTTVDEDAWVADLEADCASLNDEFAHLASSDPSDADEAVAYAEDVDEFAEAMEAVLRDAEARVPTSDPRSAELSSLLQRTVDLEDATTTLAESAASGDAAAIDEATAEVTRLGSEINELVEQLDVRSCGGF